MSFQPTRPRDKQVVPARNLFLRHVKQLDAVHQATTAGAPVPEKEPGQLNPREEELYSFWYPGLEAGNHTFKVDQIIHTPAVEDIPGHYAHLHTSLTDDKNNPE
jgi:hypothetical protein